MLGKTHIAAGVAIGTYAMTKGFIEPSLVNTIALVIGSLIPDIDKKGTTASKKAILPFHILFKHREFTHSIVGGVFFYMLIMMLFPRVIVAFMIGIASHDLMDYFTTHGIKLVWPLKIPVKFPVTMTTGNWQEQLVLFIMSVWTIHSLGALL